jgi:hypothetical protein
MSNLPTIKKLYSADLALVAKQDEFVALMNQPPAAEWVKEHPHIKGHKYIPIERVEFLLKSIFKAYKIEITGQGQSFTGVWVTARVHYIHPVTGDWMFHDGIGAAELQLRAATQQEKADGQKVTFAVENINKGALQMAYPIAKTLAVKDACDHFGKLFGSDLNRKDNIAYAQDLTIQPLNEDHPNWLKACEAVKAGRVTVESIKSAYDLSEESENYLKTLVP